ncbi:MAG: hypothetical protein QOF80_661 [Verrucomicrobiota bacterium]
MRPLGLTSLAALLVGCASPNGALDEGRYVTTYYDRNHDGLVDFELHDIPRVSDDAWALSDSKLTGRYDVRLKFGYALERERVDMPVPRNVPITPGKPPVFTTK